MAANEHFNKHMNQLQTLDGMTDDIKKSTTDLATQVLDQIKQS